jgi:hypothetical protein
MRFAVQMKGAAMTDYVMMLMLLPLVVMLLAVGVVVASLCREEQNLKEGTRERERKRQHRDEQPVSHAIRRAGRV